MAGGDWLLVETLGPESQPTVVADGCHRRDWASLLRVRRDLGPAAFRLMSEALVPGRNGELVDMCERGVRVVAVPVRCAFGAIHGVQMWVGASGEAVAPRRGVGAWDWLSKTELAHHGPGLEELIFARAAHDVRVVRTPPEVFGRMVRFDGRLEYSAVLTGTDPAGRWQGEVDLLGDDDRVRCFQMTVRVHEDGGIVTRALMHEITDVRSPRPTPELAMTRAASRADDAGVGFIELGMGVIYEWINAPPPPLDLWTTARPEIHPADVEA
ncbi:GAF domain-containing protein, partial [Nocardia gipuzkoensis]